MKKSIAIIISRLNGGGAERVASNLSIDLSDEYNVHLIVFDNADCKYPTGGMVHDLKLSPVKGSLGKLTNVIRRTIAIKKIKKKFKIICSISLMDGANLVNVLSTTGERMITSVRINMSASRKKHKIGYFVTKALMKYIATRSHYVVALSEGVRQDLIHNFGLAEKKVVTIYNACDMGRLQSLALKSHSNENALPKLSVATMGRMTAQKGQWHLIRAFSRVLSCEPNAHLYVFGEGELLVLLKQITVELSIQQNVHFMGYVEAPHFYIASCNVFVFPSVFEGLGNVLLEAMSCGVPCISCDCPSGPREILAPGTALRGSFDEIEHAEYGLLVPQCGFGQQNAKEPLTREEGILADAILAVMHNDTLHHEYAKRALARSAAFSPERISNEWRRIIEQ